MVPENESKVFNIIVNGRQKTWSEKEISYDQAVGLAFPPADANTIFTVMYHRAEGNKPAGTLVQGDTTKVKEGMVFDVTSTSRS